MHLAKYKTEKSEQLSLFEEWIDSSFPPYGDSIFQANNEGRQHVSERYLFVIVHPQSSQSISPYDCCTSSHRFQSTLPDSAVFLPNYVCYHFTRACEEKENAKPFEPIFPRWLLPRDKNDEGLPGLSAVAHSSVD